MTIEQQAARRIEIMSSGTLRWFHSDFDEDADLSVSQVDDLLTVSDAGWVCGDADLTPLGREIRRQLRHA